MTDITEREAAIEAMARVKLAKYGVSSLGTLLTTTDLQNTLTALEARGWQHVPEGFVVVSAPQPAQCLHELAPNHTNAIGTFRCLLCGEVGDFVSRRYSQYAAAIRAAMEG